MLKFVIALFLVFSCVYGQVTQNGACDQVVNAVTGFDAEAFSGFWYTVARIPSPSGDELQCSSATYEVLSANEIHVEYSDLNNGTVQLGHFTMSLLYSVDAIASFIITGEVELDDESTITYTAPFWVVDTDYETYAVVASCDAAASTRSIYGRKLSRSLNVTAEVDELMNAAIAADPYLDLTYFTDVEHSEEICPANSASFIGLHSLVLMFCAVLSKFI